MLSLIILCGISGYLLGSVAGGYIVGKLAGGIDVREFGSKNIGTTNVLRILGKKAAIFAFLVDFGKGIAAVYLTSLYIALLSPDTTELFLFKAIAGFACIAGHNWPVFLKFKGGKGVATAAGIFLVLTPLAFVFSLVTMLVIVAVTRYVSLGSIVSAAALPFFILLQGRNALAYLLLATIVAGIIIIRHHSNIKRLLAGREHKLGERIKVNPCKS